MQLDLLSLLLLPAAPLQHAAALAVQPQCQEILVGLEAGAQPRDILRRTPFLAVHSPEASPSAAHLMRLELPAGMHDAQRGWWLDELAAREGVAFAEWNGATLSPNLAGCLSVGGLSSQGCTQAFYDGAPSLQTFREQPLLQAIGARFAHRALGDAPVVVAVIDTGADLVHPALSGRLFADGFDFVSGHEGAWDVADGVDNDGDGLVDEAFGHGTHVASTVALVNPNALLLPVRVLDSDGNGSAFALAQAIHYAVDSGAQVINLSLAMHGRSTAVALALNHARDLGVDVVAAAGNTASQQVLFPADHPGVLAVAAVGFDERRSAFSAFGESVSLVAPGDGIYGAMPGDEYAWWSGTSMAAAVATGSLSLTHSLCASFASPLPPEWALLSNCRPVDALNPDAAGLLGEGRVDVGRVTRAVRRP